MRDLQGICDGTRTSSVPYVEGLPPSPLLKGYIFRHLRIPHLDLRDIDVFKGVLPLLDLVFQDADTDSKMHVRKFEISEGEFVLVVDEDICELCHMVVVQLEMKPQPHVMSYDIHTPPHDASASARHLVRRAQQPPSARISIQGGSLRC